jgi:hypothetical protein
MAAAGSMAAGGTVEPWTEPAILGKLPEKMFPLRGKSMQTMHWFMHHFF